jgi:acyl-coenzyme A synthetase/AMP-(fatty) acid ligase
MNLAAIIQRYGTTRPQAEALIDGERIIAYRELAELVAQTAAHLADLGATARDRIGLRLKDTADHLVALLAIARLGATAVPLDWRARPAENERLITAAGIKLVLVEPCSQPIAACPSATLDAAWHSAVARAEPRHQRPGDWHEPFIISASSGSTGAPKLTLMTHLQYHFAIAGMLEVMNLAGPHRYLSTLPLYYSGGRNSCIAHLLRGDCVILYPSLFDADEYVDVARRNRATVGVMVTTMIRRMLARSSAGEPLLSGLTALFSMGAPLYAEEKLQALRLLTPNFHERFGTAETLVIAVLRPEAIVVRPDSVGQPHSLGEVEVVDEKDRPLPTGTAGQLRYRGPGLASPLCGADVAFREGWFYPGEIAWLDELSYLFLEGRASEVIMRSGAKIHPAEIEQVLCEHSEIVEAAVMGQPTGNNEEEAVAFIVARSEIAVGELVAHCRTRLTPHKVPRQFHFLPQLPKNTAGKIEKLALAETLAQIRRQQLNK